MSRGFRWTLGFCVGVGAVVPLAVIVLSAVFSPAGVAVGVVLGAVYTALIIWLLRLLPIWPRGISAWWVVMCLGWGSGTSMVAAFLTAGPLIHIVEYVGWTEALASWAGAYPEEIIKTAGVGVVLFSFRRLTRPWHGLATGALIGLGFEVIENISYGATLAPSHLESDVLGALEIWVLRLSAGPILHIGWTALAGWGLGLALFAAGRSPSWRVTTALGWFMVAFVLHFGWNYVSDNDAITIATFFVVAAVFYPTLIVVTVRAVRQARADRSYVYTEYPITSVKQLPVVSIMPGDGAVDKSGHPVIQPGTRHRS